MIITGLYTYNNFLYFLNDKDQFILYRSASVTRFFNGEVPEPIIDINAIQTSISSHNYEVKIQVTNNRKSYERTKNPIFKRAADMFEEAIIQNVSFPMYVESEYEDQNEK